MYQNFKMLFNQRCFKLNHENHQNSWTNINLSLKPKNLKEINSMNKIS